MRPGQLLRRLLVPVLALCCCGWGASWKEVQRQMPHIVSIQAQFTQEKHLKILAAPLISKGQFLFQAPDSLRWEYFSPIRSILLTHDGKSQRFIEGDGNHMVKAPGMPFDAMQFVMPEIGQWLEGRFTANPAFRAELVPGKEIILRPKKKGMAEMIQRIELHFATKPGLIAAVVIAEGPDSSTRIVFHDEVLNQAIPESRFTAP